MLPFFIYGAIKYEGSFFAENLKFWSFFFSTDLWNDVQWWIYILAVLWILILCAGWQITYKLCKRIPLFDPLNAYFWLAKKIVAGRKFPTSLKKTRNSFQRIQGHTGYHHSVGLRPPKVLLLDWRVGVISRFSSTSLAYSCVAFIIWAGWTNILPFIFNNYWIFFGSGFATIGLTYVGVQVLKNNWKLKEVKEGLSGIELKSVRGQFPETGGIRLEISGTKEADLTVTQALLRIDGDTFWAALDTIIDQPYKRRLFSTFKLIFYPIKLCPDFLDPKDIQQGR